jgi:beta-phosphoglucomutase-like phosphatase (HAD superfamily)
VLKALQTLNVAPGEALAVGDADTDLAAYRSAGVRSVRAGWCPRSYDGAWDHHAPTPDACTRFIFPAP